MEGYSSLLWILVWGALFFLMMRFGCGSHIGGHGGHGHGRPSPGGKARDPVCGMEDPERAAAGAVHKGQTYYFCSISRRDKFEQAPERYAGPVGAAAQQGGHHHG